MVRLFIIAILFVFLRCEPGEEQRKLNEELFSAIENKDFAAAKLALETGADVNADEYDEYLDAKESFSSDGDITLTLKFTGKSQTLKTGESPLTRAAAAGAVDVLQLLIKRGADLEHEVESPSGFTYGTALYRAAETGKLNIVKALVKAGANADHVHLGRSVIFEAVS